ncbi:DUF3892 domain-containing protein [Paraburkholderia sediminicola]|uniref:DUF3892 domain-containing protein n=1 Tax=Paraburkholderia sediminicola TaxID=458836 RepID=UPI0038B9A3AB
MPRYQVTCITLTGGVRTHQHIATIGFSNGVRWTRQRGVDFLRLAGNSLYIADRQGTVEISVVNDIPPYLRTRADGRYTDNLLALPACGSGL